MRAAGARSEVARVLHEAGDVALVLVHLSETGIARERVDWYVREGRAVRSELSGDDVIALGVARGPQVSEVLQVLRDGRVDGRFVDRQAEIRYVRALTRSEERKG
jgi:hypothetical protein